MDFSTLRKEYKNFFVPAMKIKIDNTDISSLGVKVTNINVTLELDDPSSANFTVTNIYDIKASSINSKLKDKMKLGSKVSIELGYESKLNNVFSGYINNISYEFDEMPCATVAALDARGLMRRNIKRSYQFDEKKYSDVAKKILDKYKAICPNQKIDATDKEIEHIMQDKVSDLDFLRYVIGPRADREFLIMGDTAYFRKYDTDKTPILTLEKGKGLISFLRSSSYCNETVKVYGHDEKTKDVLVASKAVKTSDDVVSLVSDGIEAEIAVADADDESKLSYYLHTEIMNRKRGAQSGSGSCIGLPEIIPGKYIVMGTGWGILLLIVNTIIASGNEEEKNKGFAGYSAAALNGVNCGIVFGGFLINWLSHALIFLFATVLSLAVLVHVLKYLTKANYNMAANDKEKSEGKIGFWRFMTSRGVLGYFLLIVVPVISCSYFLNYMFPILGNQYGLSETNIGYSYLINGLCVICFSNALTTRLSKKIKKSYSLVLASLLYAAAFLAVAYFQNIYALLAVLVLLGISDSFGLPLQTSYYTDLEAVKQYGYDRAMGIYSLFENISQTGGSYIFSIVLLAGVQTGLYIVVIILVLLALLFALLYKINNRKKASAAKA